MPMQPERYCTGTISCRNKIKKGIRFCKDCQGLRDKARPNVLLRRLYFTSRWFRLRREVLDAQPACYDCEAAGRLEPATDVHHKTKPANAAEFFDRQRLGALCHSCHSKRTARGE